MCGDGDAGAGAEFWTGLRGLTGLGGRHRAEARRGRRCRGTAVHEGATVRGAAARTKVRPYEDQLKNFTMRRIEVTRASMSAGVLYT